MALDRRTYVAAVVTTAVAGCLGGGSGDGSSSGGTDGSSGTDGGPSLPPPVQGDPNADVTVMVFEDFACPHCAEYVKTVHPKIVSNYTDPGVIRYEHHDFPIPVSPQWSWAVASAARAVQDGQGDAAFFDYAESCFANQANYTYDLLASLASDVGADGATVRSAAEQGTYRSVVEQDRALGTKMGLQGTPEVYVNGKRLDAHDYATVSSAIDAQR